jgi:hypothetical protein
VLVLALVGVGCGEDADPNGDAGDDNGDEAFCAAVEALDGTDGTTDSSVVLAGFEEMRRTAPPDISDDVNKSLDHIVLGDFPEAADASMEKMAPAERQAAARRMAAYLEEHCP